MSETGSKYVARLAAQHHPLRQLLEGLSEEQAGVTLWPGSMTLLELVDHLSHTHELVMNDIHGEAKVGPTRSASLARARERFEGVTRNEVDVLRRLTDADLQRVVEPFPQVYMTIEGALDLLIEHDAHHKGQLWVAARHLGITPPLFVYLAALASPSGP